jgi:hypothetical protein
MARKGRRSEAAQGRNVKLTKCEYLKDLLRKQSSSMFNLGVYVCTMTNT